MHIGLGDDAEFGRKFVAEARAAAKLSHPNVVAVFDQGDDDGTLFLAMEFVPGRTLRDVVRQQARCRPARALDLLSPVLSALSAAHDAGIVHRDIKPENVLIADDGKVKVADFGLARAVTAAGDTATQGLLIGTVSYLAPELVTDGRADARSDVYSAGIMLYELLTGVKPHSGDTPIQVAYGHVHADVPAPSKARPGIPPYVDALVQRATARDRDLRPADARVFSRQVRRVRSALDEGPDRRPGADRRPDRADPADAPGQTGSTTATAGTAGTAGAAHDTIVVLRALPEPPTTGRGHPTADPAEPAATAGRAGPRAVRADRRARAGARGGGAAWFYGVQRYTPRRCLLNLTQPRPSTKAREAGLKTELPPRTSREMPAGQVDAAPTPSRTAGSARRAVKLFVSRGPERYSVPQLAGLDGERGQRPTDRSTWWSGSAPRSTASRSRPGR